MTSVVVKHQCGQQVAFGVRQPESPLGFLGNRLFTPLQGFTQVFQQGPLGICGWAEVKTRTLISEAGLYRAQPSTLGPACTG